ncbi:hypothetical protein UA75_20880 [Actinoalloteichus sp. GBA129-24]|uniref:Uncharacterized protein n=1 Tax=Actinoalloteichus fjordicus TaxID=1612552 RepID=A0AAC9PTI9_9PSEU|nr:hypothetical protein UA74_20375 [Actinoalloteichus fjordicus]APU22165.1 hypothetical protein UA75_20880 [Actinoalloteichus sp. GBA129-24]
MIGAGEYGIDGCAHRAYRSAGGVRLGSTMPIPAALALPGFRADRDDPARLPGRPEPDDAASGSARRAVRRLGARRHSSSAGAAVGLRPGSVVVFVEKCAVSPGPSRTLSGPHTHRIAGLRGPGAVRTVTVRPLTRIRTG